ncbi:MAG: histidinol-phosphatase HisJ family protein [Mogibacterium sp.]|nr:histidinol-phosphatase HisJ family protein [Mogibacterium sp.]
MTQKFDLHMHTTYCDGNNSAEEMVLAALDMGFETIGFSGHSYTWFDESYCMSPDGTRDYIAEIRALGEKYSDRIRILLGTELDYWAEIDTTPYDYLIGSSHYILKDGEYIDSDYSPEILMTGVNKHFGGDPLAAAEAYYKQVGNIISKTGCDIIGHFDLITKFNETAGLDASGKLVKRKDDAEAFKNAAPIMDTADSRYIAAWKKAIDQIFEDTMALRAAGHKNRLEELGLITAGDKPVFEINTGAMAKGYRTSPYPAQDQIEYIRSKGGVLILNSDSHSITTIGHVFDRF